MMEISFPPKKIVYERSFLWHFFVVPVSAFYGSTEAQKPNLFLLTRNRYANTKIIFSSSANYDRRMIISKALCDLLFAQVSLLNSFAFLPKKKFHHGPKGRRRLGSLILLVVLGLLYRRSVMRRQGKKKSIKEHLSRQDLWRHPASFVLLL